MGEVGGRGGALMRRTRRAVHIVIIILILPQILGSLPTKFFRAVTHHHHPSPPNLDIKLVHKCEAEIEPRWASW